MISEETIRKTALGWLTVLKELLVIGTLAWGFFGALPWVKNKVKRAETVADSTLALVSSIQTQLQIQIQQQAQLQAQIQEQVQAQKQEQIQDQGQQQGQSQSNIQNAEFSPSLTVNADSLRDLSFQEKPDEMDTIVECGGWLSVKGSRDADFGIDCFHLTLDSIRVKVRFSGFHGNKFQAVLKKGEDTTFHYESPFEETKEVRIQFKDIRLFPNWVRVWVKFVPWQKE